MSITSGLLLVGLVTCVFYYIRRWAAGGVCQSKRRLDGKTVIITGANSGMGKETAVNLAERGARVILACRNDKRGEAAVAEVKQRSGSNAVLYRKLDLEELESIRKFANKIVEDDERVDILINNAGIWAHPHSKTVDGFETHFGVNYIGHFYLTNLLLGRLRASAPSRVVNVSSRAHMIGRIDLDEVDGKATRTRPYKKMIAYAESKLAVVLFTRELAKRLDGTGVTTYVVHPGCVRTRLQRMLSGTLIGYVYNAIYPFLCVLWKSPSEGAQTTIHCAVDERLDNVSGRYYVDCAESRLAACAEDNAVAQKLWEISEKQTSLVKQ